MGTNRKQVYSGQKKAEIMHSPTLVIDSNYLCHRAYHTTGEFRHKDQPTGVIYGFFNQVFTLVERFRPSNVAFCWDSRESIRKKITSTYKANRKNEEPTQELLDAYAQFDLLRTKIIPGIGIVNNFIRPGYEADDLIAQIVLAYQNECLICSGDEDLFQLLSFAKIYNPAKKEYITEQDFINKWGIQPIQWSRVKALAGCSSDNVIGISGIGEKTAAKYLLGKLDKNSVKGRAIENANKELIDKNLSLVQLPLPGLSRIVLDENQFSQMEFERVCKKYGFRNLRGMEDWYLYF